MTAREVDYAKIDEVADDGIRLFKIMMRLEFALKDTGYGVSGRGTAAEVNWDRYANERLGSAFWEEIKGSDGAKPLIHTPPQRQAVDQHGNLHWENAGEVSSIQDLIGALRRVRNNLFHGGKSGDPDARRNAELYAAALYVIDQILREDDVLRTSFTGQY